jgi:hypothetical protein
MRAQHGAGAPCARHPPSCLRCRLLESLNALSCAPTGTGLDFSAASAVVFAELPDEVATVRQAEDRAHRNGQTRPVNVYFLLAKGTCDERRCTRALCCAPHCLLPARQAHLLTSASAHVP